MRSKEFNSAVFQAQKSSMEANHRSSSEHYYQAARIAKELRDTQLHYQCLYYYYIETLIDSDGKSIDSINSVIDTLYKLSSLEDDRLKDRVEPIIDFFMVLKHCLMDDTYSVKRHLEQIRVKTEHGTSSQVESVTHLICESYYVKDKLIKCKERLDSDSLKCIMNELASLENCIERHRNNMHLSPDIKRIFEYYSKCIESIKLSEVSLIVRRCIDDYLDKVRTARLILIITNEFKSLFALSALKKIRQADDEIKKEGGKDESEDVNMNVWSYASINNILVVASLFCIIYLAYTYNQFVAGMIIDFLVAMFHLFAPRNYKLFHRSAKAFAIYIVIFIALIFASITRLIGG